MAQVRTLTDADRSLLRLALANAGIKARVRKFPGTLRVVFEGARESVERVLNDNDFRNACGRPFDRDAFEGEQVFIRYVGA